MKTFLEYAGWFLFVANLLSLFLPPSVIRRHSPDVEGWRRHHEIGLALALILLAIVA